MNRKELKNFTQEELNKIIKAAWEDRVTFEEIYNRFKLRECDIIYIMRRELKNSSFRLWRKRVSGRLTKHKKLNNFRRFIDHPDAISDF